MENDVDVAVIGAGIMGASTAWRLAARGLRTLLVEQFDLDHVRGSSHGASRIFRLAYDEPDYVRLSQRALPLWREAEEALGAELLWTTGGLDFGPARNVQPIADALEETGVPFERLTEDAIHARYSAYAVPQEWEAIYQPDGGVLRADACRRGLAELSRRAGARLELGTTVTRLIPSGNGVQVECGTVSWLAGCAVVTAAGWANRLLTPLGLPVPLRVTREHVAYFRYQDDRRLLPFVWHASDAPFDFYGLPNGSTEEAKVGEHGVGPEVDPDTIGAVDNAQLNAVDRFARAYLPALGDLTSGETCLYASTPDDDFVLDRIGPLVLGLGFGGHGFKFGAAIGDVLADLATGRPCDIAPRFRYARFQKPALDHEAVSAGE